MTKINPALVLSGSLGKAIRSFIYLYCAVPLLCFGQAGTSFPNPIELGSITSFMPQNYLMGYYYTGQYSNIYGSSSPDIVHRFAVSGNSVVDVWVYTSALSRVYVLDQQLNQLSVDDFPPSFGHKSLNLSSGTYFLVFEADVSDPNSEPAVIDMTIYVNDDSGIVAPTTGMNISIPIIIPTNPDGSIDFNDMRSFEPIFGYGNNHYVGSYDDIYYRFELPQRTNIKTFREEVYFSGGYSLHVLNSTGGNVFSTTTYDGTVDIDLDPGVYYLVVDGESFGAGANYHINLQTSKKPSDGIALSDAILIGNYTLGGSYSYHDSRSNESAVGYGNEMGQPSDDIYYKLVIGNTSTVSASLCGSDFDTYLYLLSSGGTVLQSNNDNGPSCTGTQSSLLATNLAAGTYYIVAEGNGNVSGNLSLSVSTEVQGIPDPVASLAPMSITGTENYILTRTVLVDNLTTDQQLAGVPRSSIRAEVMYFDGLGRPVQQIAIGASPTGKDIVTPVGYDSFGRENKKYLPYEATTGGASSSGSMRTDALSAVYTNGAQYQFYQQDHTSIPKLPNPYAQQVFEPSPLNRVNETASPGKVWGVGSGHTVESSYAVNSAGEVRLWEVTSSSGAYTGATTNGQYYPAGQLYKNVTVDENGSKLIEFKDKSGNILCKKVQDGGNAAYPTFTTTDYIYDKYANLTYVVPPALENLTSFTEISIEFLNYIYAYHHDGRKRLAEKKIPAEGWSYMVYNAADQPILSQDASHRERIGGAVWSFMKYDRLGRVIMTGEMRSSQSRNALQSIVDLDMKPSGSLLLQESRDNSGHFGYTAASYPDHTVAEVKIFTVNYFDRYDFLSIPAIAAKPQIYNFRQPSGTAAESTAVIGLQTGSLSRILGTNDFLLSETLYDSKGRVGAVITEHQLNGVDEVTNNYSFVGELLTSNRKHYRNNALALSINRQNTYDHTGRVTQSSEQINQQAPAITKYSYNALGQLEVKKVGGKSIVHSYNPRGWLSKASSPLFSFSLYYDYPADLSRAQFNGNISEQVWTLGPDSTSHRYAYSYDRANRLLSGISDGGYGETLTYDKMGNINSLIRTGLPSIAGASGTFVYSYGSSGNQLQSFTNGSSYSRSFQYNTKGSVIADGQMKMSYNELNLPGQVTDNNNVPKVSYLYDALGTKLTTQSPVEVRQYIGGIEYVGSGSSATIDLLHVDGGIARKSGATYQYNYFLTDHLGNTRVVYNDAGEVLQQTDYYPFGMEINRKVTSPKVNYTYNGKELQQELGQYDYGARFYDPVIGRWNVVDPLAEMGRRWSPYTYAMDNPVRYIDPDGMLSSDINGVTITDPDEIADLLKRLKQNEKDEDQDDPKKKKGTARSIFDGLKAGLGDLAEGLAPIRLATEEDPKSLGEFLNNLKDAPENMYMVYSEGNLEDKIRLTLSGLSIFRGKPNKVSLNIVIPKGFKEVKEFGKPHGQKVYKKGTKYYSRDADGHNGGMWKVFEKHGEKLKRIGTADKDLNIFKK